MDSIYECIYIYVCVCVCVCVYILSTLLSNLIKILYNTLIIYVACID
jgi:hypothetical protein